MKAVLSCVQLADDVEKYNKHKPSEDNFESTATALQGTVKHTSDKRNTQFNRKDIIEVY
jgi:hypothetical protein